MDLHLSFQSGAINGEGNDDVGPFLIKGRYDPATRECHWTKSYIGRHDVAYRGFGEGKGIWGTWEIQPWSRGGFHIWPRGSGEGEALDESSQESQPADAVATVCLKMERLPTPTPQCSPIFRNLLNSRTVMV